MNDTDPLELLRAAGARARKPFPPPAAEPVAGVAEPPPPEPSVDDPPPVEGEPAAAPARTSAGSLPVWPARPADDPDAVVPAPYGGGAPSAARTSALDGVVATGERRRRRKHSSIRNLVEWAVVLLGALLVALAVKTWLVQAFYIPSGSMEPTLQVGDRILVNKVSYDLDEVDRGDIVVFERPETWGSGDIDDLIKRVIALPGETVAVVDGVIHIDGAPLDEPWLADGVQTPTFFEESGCVPQCTIPEGELFVLGDNRPHSDASNHFGPVPFDDVVGRAFVRLWPVGDIGGI